ncbi:hypothetical protein OAK75_01465 [Bacteriovoracales bacterium]|nr:hypothetical protein [Bacteriovoracales bacterium]
MGIFKFVIIFFLLGSPIYASDHSSNEKECLDSKAKNYLKSLRSFTLPVKGYSIKKRIKFHEEKAINFKANLKALSRGYVQFAKATYTDLEMRKFRKSPYYSLDFLGWNKMPNIALSIYRYAYITPRKNVEWFSLKKMTDRSFLEKTIKGVVPGGIKVGKPVELCSKVSAKFKTDLDMGGIKIGTVVFRGDYYSLDRKNLVGKNFSMNELNGFFETSFEKSLGAPQKVTLLKIKEGNKNVLEEQLIKGGIFILQHWPLKSKGTLTITTRIMAIKVPLLPPFPWFIINASNNSRDYWSMAHTVLNVINFPR